MEKSVIELISFDGDAKTKVPDKGDRANAIFLWQYRASEWGESSKTMGEGGKRLKELHKRLKIILQTLEASLSRGEII